MRRFTRAAVAAALLECLAGCGYDSPKSRYLLAERLWNDGKHSAAVLEFERVHSRDPRGRLGLQALFRAAITQTIYLGQHGEAVRKLRTVSEGAQDPRLGAEARKQAGEILYSRMENYEEAVTHYQGLLSGTFGAQWAPDERAEFMFRVGKGYFYLSRFREAVESFQAVLRDFPGSPMAEEALFEIGLCHYTQGEQSPGGQQAGSGVYRTAIATFEKLIRDHPKSPRAVEARFWIASSLEELDLLDRAYSEYEAIRKQYPSPSVVDIKLTRIRERKSQRNR